MSSNRGMASFWKTSPDGVLLIKSGPWPTSGSPGVFDFCLQMITGPLRHPDPSLKPLQRAGEEVMALGPTQGGFATSPLTIPRLECIWVGLYDKMGGGRPPLGAAKRKSGGAAPSALFATLLSAASWVYRLRTLGHRI